MSFLVRGSLTAKVSLSGFAPSPGSSSTSQGCLSNWPRSTVIAISTGLPGMTGFGRAVSSSSRVAAKAWAAQRPSRQARTRSFIDPSVGLRQTEHLLGDEAEDHLRRDRRDAPNQRLAQVALDVVLGGVAIAAVGHDRLLAGVEARLAGQILGRVRLGAAGLAGVVERGRLERHQPGRLERRPVRRERMLDRLVLA